MNANKASLGDILHLAVEHHNAGNLAEAERLYREILQAEPNHGHALHLLGLVAHQAGQHEIAVEYIEKAIELVAGQAAFHHNLGEAYRALGRIAQAIACHERALLLQPDLIESRFNLGLAFQQQGSLVSASACFEQILAQQPGDADAHFALGNVRLKQGEPDAALRSFHEALRLRPGLAEAHHKIGVICVMLGRLDDAVLSFQKTLRLDPAHPWTHNNLAETFRRQGRLEEALVHFQRALKLRPNLVEAYRNLGVLWLQLGKPDQAIPCLEEAIRLKPNHADTYNNLGNAFLELRRMDEARVCFEEALRQKPDLAEAHNNLGIVLWKMDLLDEATASFQQALLLTPESADFHSNLGNVRKDQGRIEEALACYRRARKLRPDNPIYDANLLCGLSYHPGYTAGAILAEHQQWEKQYALPYSSRTPEFTNERSSERRLRIGYVSPDFRDHVVGRNIWPFLCHHNHTQCEIALYANMVSADAFTARFQQCADRWCSIAGWSDDRVADTIRQDGIDILVDLALHTAGNRLLVFARKPAPVQVTFAGYPGTTGLRAIDYRLTDPYLDPPGENDGRYAERSYRLAHTFWCYDPVGEEPAVNSLPAARHGFITFGCLNNFCKVNDEVLSLWAQVLRGLPESRLVLLAKQGSHQERTIDFFKAQGVSAERIAFVGSKPRTEYLALYRELDLVLDTFPYNGHTTSLDAFWMGVPVITLIGDTVVARAGLSQLSNLGLQEFAAASPEGFVRISAELAHDLPRLAAVRADLRERMRQSPLMDAVGFAREIEAAYREMWRTWCAA